MPVKIVAEREALQMPGSDYVRVSTCSDPLDDTVTLATIQRVVEKHLSAPDKSVHIKTLVLKQPMSCDDALGLATCYAERKNISVVYTD